MNLAVIIVIILLIGARKQTPEGIPEPTPPNPNLKTGTITFDGSRRREWYDLGPDYDFRVQVDGFTVSTNMPVTAYSGPGRAHGTDTWDYSHKTPEWVFQKAWDNYLDAGGDATLNWNVVFTDRYYEYAKKDAVYDKVLGLLQIFFPHLRTTIENSIPEDIREDIEIVINA